MNDSIRAMFFAGLIFLLFMHYSCAKVGTPTGGPKDINPPVYVGGTPAERSTNFNGKEVDLTFDEFIQLKDQNRELIISPPLEKRPLVRVRDKTIRITLNNELIPQTTYTLNFGNSVTDINEGNVLPDYEFVFSTGNTIDSLSVIGKVVNAFDLKPSKEEEVMVGLYTDLSDSAPLLKIPTYIGRASKTGLFSINNIPADTFRMIALKDANNNRKYDPGNESVAFMDSLLIVSPGNVKPVTFIRDTVKIIRPGTKAAGKKTPAVKADTIIAPGKNLNAVNISLFYFQEESKKVFLDTKKRESPEKLLFIFSRPPHDTVRLEPLNFTSAKNWLLREYSGNKDTLTCWITDTLIARLDTLKLKVTYLTTDSANQFVSKTDTLSLRFQIKSSGGSQARKGKSETTPVKKNVLALAASIGKGGSQNLNQPIVFTTGRPLDTLKPGDIELFRIEDSISIVQPFTVIKDSVNIRAFRLKSGWQEGSQYRLIVRPGAVTDIYGLKNDSLALTFATQKAEYYGRILLTLNGDRFPLLVQLLDERETVTAQQSVNQSGLIVFDYLAPRKYLLKVIFDRNNNRKWDTGNYLKHIQPEKVYYHILSEPVRSNWDHEVTWNISD